MKNYRALILVCGVMAILGAAPSKGESIFNTELSHSGGTDKCGCHYNKKTGEYHCHKRKQRGGDCPA